MPRAPSSQPPEVPEEPPQETVEAGELGEEAANHIVKPVEAHQSTVSRHELHHKAFEAERAGESLSISR